MGRDIGLDTLLGLNGTRFVEESGYWYKIDVWLVEASPQIPHGIRYNMTLHDPYNRRIMGFDNAHAPKTDKKPRYRGRVVEYDHIHNTPADWGSPYAFESAEQLLEDFFKQVNKILNKLEG